MKKRCSVLFILIMVLTLFTGCGQTKDEENQVDSTMQKQVETEHFIFYSTDKDKSCIDDLYKELNESYDRVTTDLGTGTNEKIEITIFPDINMFHKAIGQVDAEDSVVGCGGDNKIAMVSPLNPEKVHNYESVKKVIVHEFVHVVIENISNDVEKVPIWLNEGTAVYEARQMDDKKITDFISQKVEANSIPTLDELSSNFQAENYSYVYSYTLAKCYIEKFGIDKLRLSLENPSDMYKIIGVSKEDFESQWNQYLKDNYKVGNKSE